MPENPLQIKVSEDMQKLLVEVCIDDYKKAEDARNKRDYGQDDKGAAYTFDSKLESLKDMFYGKRKPKTVPWRYCSNRSMKIAMAILEMLHSRMFAAIWNEDLVRWMPGERTDKEKVERINKFMDWWIRVHTRMKNFFDKWTKVATGFGDVTTEMSWDVKYIDKGEVETSPITDEFGIQLFEKDGTPSVSTSKKFYIEEKTKCEIISRENLYLQEGQKSLEDETVIIKLKYLYSDLEQMERDGKVINVEKDLRPKIEYKINTQFSNNNEEDIEIVKEVKLRNTPIEVLKIYKKIDIDRDGFQEDIRLIIDPIYNVYLGGIAVKDISKNGKRPLDFTKLNDLIDRPDELEGLGILEMVKPLSDEIDAIFNQITDSNTLSVLRPFFYDPGGNLVPQNITLAPNKGIPVSDPSRNVFIPDMQVPTERLLLAMRTVMEFIERLTGASSYVMGKESEVVGGSGTATRTQAIVMASEQRFAIPAQRLREGCARILTKIFDLVQKNVPPGLENRVLGEDGEPIFHANELTEEGLSGELDAYILEDASQGSANTERQLAVFLYQILLQNPIVGSDPIKIYMATANLLKAHRVNPEEFLGPIPEMSDFDSPEDENTKILQGDFAKVRANLVDNHMQHIMVHQKVQMSPTLAAINPNMYQEILQYTQSHVQEHMQYMQQMIAMQQMGGKGGPGQQAGAAQGAPGMDGSQGSENMPGPVGAMARTKEQGVANPAQTAQVG